MEHPAQPAPLSTPPPATLDVAGAMALLGNDEDLYLQIAEAFRTELVALPTQLDALLHHNAEPAEARRLLHTFKGLSLTVGALALSEACRQVEARLKETQAVGAMPATDALIALRHQLTTATDATLQALLPILDRLAPSAPHGVAPVTPVQPVCDVYLLVQDLRALELLLAASDMRAVDVQAALQKRHEAAGVPLGALRDTVHSFDFAQGVVQCRALIRTLSDNN